MQRRKFLIGLGALGAGSVAAMGTGAFSSASIPDRRVNVSVDADHQSTVALVPGDDPDVYVSDEGQLVMDLTGADGQGVNINSLYTWGNPNDPAADYAFKLVNNDEESLVMKMNYYFEDTQWIVNRGNGQSFIRFQVFDLPPSNAGSSAQNYPHQSYNKDYSLGGPTGDWSPGGSHRFNPGEEYYVVVSVDTTGPNASTDDDLAGTANFVFTANAGINQDSWYPDNPP